jgi:hypothetical protein
MSTEPTTHDDGDMMFTVQERWVTSDGLEVTRELGHMHYEPHAGDVMQFAELAEGELTNLRRTRGMLRLFTTDGRVFLTPYDKIAGVYVELVTEFGDLVEQLEPGFADPDGDPDDLDAAPEEDEFGLMPAERAVMDYLVEQTGMSTFEDVTAALGTKAQREHQFFGATLRTALTVLADRGLVHVVDAADQDVYEATEKARLMVTVGPLSEAARALLGKLVESDGDVALSELVTVSGPSFTALSERGIKGVMVDLVARDLAERVGASEWTATDNARLLLPRSNG